MKKYSKFSLVQPKPKAKGYPLNSKKYDKGQNGEFCPEFTKICRMDVPELREYLKKVLSKNGYKGFVHDKWIFGVPAKEGIPVLVTAHMDTVHVKNVETVVEYIESEKHIITSPEGIGGDDRCGIYMILELLKRGHKPLVLFCDEEETGGHGSESFCNLAGKYSQIQEAMDSVKFMIELDRANATDAVYYDCDNPEFNEFVSNTTGYKEDWGSFSDISNLAPHFGKAAVNLSCGYYKAHTTDEYVVIEEMMNSIDAAEKLLTAETKEFEYIEAINYEFGKYGYGGYYDYYDYYDRKYTPRSESGVMYEIGYVNDEGDYDYEEVVASSEAEAIGLFLLDHSTLTANDVSIIDYWPM